MSKIFFFMILMFVRLLNDFVKSWWVISLIFLGFIPFCSFSDIKNMVCYKYLYVKRIAFPLAGSCYIVNYCDTTKAGISAGIIF